MCRPALLISCVSVTSPPNRIKYRNISIRQKLDGKTRTRFAWIALVGFPARLSLLTARDSNSLVGQLECFPVERVANQRSQDLLVRVVQMI